MTAGATERKVLASRIRHWGNLPEQAMRGAQLRRFLQRVSATTAVRALEELLVTVRAKDESPRLVYLALIQLLEDAGWVRGRLPEWRREAFRQGVREVIYLLSDPGGERYVHDDEEGPLSHPELQDITLGEKKAWARRSRQKDFHKFYAETHPQVLEILFSHPAMTEAQLLRFLSRRPLYPEVVATALRFPRWLSSRSVQRSLSLNPYTPTRIALRLLPLLALEDLREIRDAEDLTHELRGYAEVLLAMQDYADSVEDFERSSAGTDLA